jgi:hypothetical protein
MAQILKITRDTLLKRRPLQSEELPTEELHGAARGVEYEIESYAYADANGDFDGHIKFVIKNPRFWIRGFNTWYAFNRDAKVEFNGQMVYPQEDQIAIQTLRIVEDTVFKRRPVQASELAARDRHDVAKGSAFQIQSYAYTNSQGNFNNHLKIALRNREDFINGFSTWYVYNQHAQVTYDGRIVYPPSRLQRFYSGMRFYLPGYRSTFYTDQAIIPGGNFTWAEATNGGERIPQTFAEVNNILDLAIYLQRARDQIGQPFYVTSWYRPEPYNTWAGGVPNSQHLSGRAVDFWVDGYTGRELAFAFLPWWPGGIGTYGGSRDQILHLDIGPRRTWGF